jgi:predicted kinase
MDLHGEIFKDFTEHYKGLCRAMKNSDHNWSETKLNPYHAEGSVYTHVCMVYNMACVLYPDDLEVLLACLVHDLGKPWMERRKEDTERVSFFNHEYASSVQAVEFLRKYLNDDEVLRVLKVVANHTMVFRGNVLDYIHCEKEFDLIKKLGVCDHLGRVSLEDSSTQASMEAKVGDWYEKHAHVQPIKDEDKVLHIMIGLPGSGKSTIGKTLGTVFAPDTKLMEIANRGKQEYNYNDAFAHCVAKKIDWTKECIKDLFDCDDQHIVLDATNMTLKRRRRICTQAHTKRRKIKIHMVWRSINECKACRSTDKNIPDMVYKQMISSFNYPTLDECDEIEHYLI